MGGMQQLTARIQLVPNQLSEIRRNREEKKEVTSSSPIQVPSVDEFPELYTPLLLVERVRNAEDGEGGAVHTHEQIDHSMTFPCSRVCPAETWFYMTLRRTSAWTLVEEFVSSARP